MSDIQRLMAISDGSFKANRQAIEDALVMCVTPVQACRAFDLSFVQPHSERNVLIRKLERDIRRRPLKAHYSLIARLEEATTTARGAKRLSAADSCLFLTSALSWREESRLLDRLSGAKNASIRGQVFRRIKENDHRPLPSFVERSWRTFGDWEATRLLIDRGKREVVRRNFVRLEELVKDTGWMLGRLYLRLEGHAPATTKRLFALSPLTYAYVCAKLGKRAPRSVMKTLLIQLAGWKTFGLAAWCCGEMGYRDLLADAPPLIEAVERHYDAEGAKFRSSMGV